MWENLKQIQNNLDERYMKEFNIDFSMLHNERFLALTCEIMEYAKATRCFKYWSKKEADPEHIRLEEFVDGIHFFLSWFNSLGVSAASIKDAEQLAALSRDYPKNDALSYHLSQAICHVNALQVAFMSDHDVIENLRMGFAHYWLAGQLDGFTAKDIELAYYIKNNMNHHRQDTGY